MTTSFDEHSQFDWAAVNIRFSEAEHEIGRYENFTDDLAETVREEARAYNDKFDEVCRNARPNFDKVYAAGDKSRPATVSELVVGLERGGQYWAIARNLYEHAAGHAIDDAVIQKFVAQRPPFHALMTAFCAALYDRNVRPPNDRRTLRAGWADILMAACLPYRDHFVTNDFGQAVCYKEIVSLADLKVGIRPYEEFRRGLCLA